MLSNLLEVDLHRAVDYLVELGDWLDVGIPPVLSSHLLNSSLLGSEPVAESIVPSLPERSLAASRW